MELNLVVTRIRRNAFQRGIKLKQKWRAKAGLLLIPKRGLLGVVRRRLLDMQSFQARRSLSSNPSRTSLHGRPACGLSR